MKIKYNSIILLTAILSLASGCSFFEVEDTIDPNAASLESVTNNPSQNQINFLGVGVQSVLRNGMRDFYLNSGSQGREIIYSASTDNRYFNELLGTESANFNGANDPNGIFNTYYFSFSQTRRRAELFTRSAETAVVLSAAQKAGILGFVRTVQGYVMLNLLNMQFENGIRESFSDLSVPGDLLKPGPFGNYTSGLALVKATLDEGKTALQAAGSDFAFPMSTGWTGFNTPAEFLKFNRAIAARVAIYQQDFPGALTALGESFLNVAGPLTVGPVFTFSTTAGDQTNALWHRPNDNGAPYVVFNEHITDAEAGDTRLTSKTTARAAARQSGQFTSTHEVTMYASNISNVSIIRNEELILMYAEAQIRKAAPDLAQARIALDAVRAGAGLANLATAKPTVDTQAEFLTQLQYERRYSLFFEGHRWIDARRFGITLPNTSAPFVQFSKFSRPDAEVQWDVKNPQ